MARSFAKQFYASPAWKRARETYRKSVGGLCERCRAKGLYTPAEIVHHIIELTPENIHDTSVTLDARNLMAVCRNCHAEIHAGGGRKRWTIDEGGRVAPLVRKF